MTLEGAVLRVLRVSPRTVPHLGGQEIHVDELTKHLSVMGIEQTLAYTDGTPDPASARLIHLSIPRIGGTILKDSLLGLRFALLPKQGFDIVHTHGDAPIARGGAIAAHRMSAAHVHTFHGDLVARGARAVTLRAMLPRHSWYLAVSRQIARSLAAAHADPERIFVRTSGVREQFFRPSEGTRKPDVAIGGRLVPAKRIAQFVRTWAATDTGESQLHVFGSGPEAGAIGEIARTAANVDWVGELDASRLSGVLTSVAVGVVMGQTSSPTRSSEGTPTLALEMLSAGCFPIVGGPTGEMPRLVRRFAFGEIREEAPGPDEVAAIARTWSGPTAEDDRARVRTLARNTLSWRAVAAQIAAFYEQISPPGSRARRL